MLHLEEPSDWDNLHDSDITGLQMCPPKDADPELRHIMCSSLFEPTTMSSQINDVAYITHNATEHMSDNITGGKLLAPLETQIVLHTTFFPVALQNPVNTL